MDGRQVDIDGEDYQRRDSIAQLLEDWGLIVIEDSAREDLFGLTNNFRVISFKQKDDWTLKAKYTIGN